MVKEESLTGRWDLDLLGPSLKVDFRMAAVPTPHAGRAGLGAVDQILALPDLVDLFL